MMRLRQALRKRVGKPWPVPVTPSLNILPSRVTAAQAKATGNTSQWTAFKSRLDGQLNSVVPGAFEGGNLPWLADYALGRQALLSADPTTATNYGLKAVALLLWMMSDYQLGSRQSGWQLVARGDGATTAFTLSNTPTAGTFQVALVPINTQALVKGSANGQDQLDSVVYHPLKISNTSDGTPAYTEGVDWQHTGNYRPDFIDWSLAGSEPSVGATYYVTSADLSNTVALSSGYTQTGTSLTFTTAPTSSQVVVVNYMYSSGGNPYRQTANGFGGLNNVFIDSSFTARYLFYAVCAYDWVYDLLDSGTRATLENLFVQWDAWVKNQSQSAITPAQPAATTLAYWAGGVAGLQSNYQAGYYAMRCAIAAALNGRNVNASTIQTGILSWRTSYLQRDLRDNAGVNNFCSYKGGWDVEGWGDYAPGAAANLLWGSDILADAGLLADKTSEQAWAGEVMRCLVHSILSPSTPVQSGQVGTVYPGGDFGLYPADLPDRDLVAAWGAFTSDSQAASYAAYYTQNLTSALTTGAFDLLYRDPSATATNWTSTEPLFYYASGSGLILSRAAWDYASTVYSFELGDQGIAGHNTYSCGTVFAWRGSDDLLVCATQFNGSESVTNKLANGNLVLIGTTQSANNNGPSHHTNIKSQGGAAAYTYAEGDYLGAYWTGSTNPATECTRVVLHVRPDYLFVYDRCTVSSSTTAMQLQWYLSTTPTVTGNGWATATRGSSKLFGHTYSSTTLTTAADTPTVAGSSINRVKVNASVAQTTIRYASVLQAAPSATASMDASAFVTSSSGAAMEGVLIGTVLALFGKTLTSAGATGYQVTTPTTYSYTAPGGTVTHYVCDLTPNQTYTLSGAASGTATASAAGVLTFQTSGSGSQTVTIT